MFHLLKNYIIIAKLTNFFIMYKYVHFGDADHHEGTQIKSVRAVIFTASIHSLAS